jgi:hypothetical protein
MYYHMDLMLATTNSMYKFHSMLLTAHEPHTESAASALKYTTGLQDWYYLRNKFLFLGLWPSSMNVFPFYRHVAFWYWRVSSIC